MNSPAFATPSPVLPRAAAGLRSAAVSRAAARPARAARRAPAAMVAAATTGAALSERAEEMLSWVRAHKSIFSPGAGFTATHLALTRKNDTARCMVPADELDCNEDMLPGVAVARSMLKRADEVVEEGKAAAVAVMPALESEEAVAKILYHDVRYFLRVLQYGVAVGSPNFIHDNNLGIVKQLYAEIGLEDKTVQASVAAMKASVLKDASTPEEKQIVNNCFDKLSSAISQ